MRKDCLLSLSRLRKLAVDEAKRDLARTVSAAVEAMTEAEKARARIAQECLVATSDPTQARAFATWVPHGQALARGRAEEAALREIDLGAERERLAQARAAERAVEELAAQRDELRQLEAMRKIQAVADEIAADRTRRKREGGFREPAPRALVSGQVGSDSAASTQPASGQPPIPARHGIASPRAKAG